MPWICVKCGTTVDGERSICRACGAARTVAPSSAPGGAAPTISASPVDISAIVDEPDATDVGAASAPSWACPKCRTLVEGEFEVCWRCGTSNIGIEDPDFRRVADVASAPSKRSPLPDGEPESGAISAPPGMPPDRRCTACGEALRPIQLVDTGGRSVSDHQELSYAAIGALTGGFFGDPVEGVIRAQLCPRCGRVTLYAVPTT